MDADFSWFPLRPYCIDYNMNYPTAYRPNVGLIILNTHNQVWLGKRFGLDGPYCWQFPQGGIDEGEDIETAALRELYEETGMRTVTLLGRTKDWITYDFPPEVLSQNKIGKNFRGQKQVWYAVRFEGEECEINLTTHGEQEFSEWIWTDFDTALTKVVPFKRPSYQAAIAELLPQM